MTQVLSSPSVHTTLNYFLHPDEGGSFDYYPGTAQSVNRPVAPRPVDVTDIRLASDDFTLDQQGFQIVQHTSVEKEFTDKAKVENVVYPEVIDVLKKVTGASHVLPMNHFVRTESWETAKEFARTHDDMAPLAFMPAAGFVHVDQSYDGARQILDHFFPSQDRHKTRWAIINVWRPVERTVSREPLAVCDARTVPESDLVEIELKKPPDTSGSLNYKGPFAPKKLGSWQVKPNPEHRWYYASALTPDEVLLIKIFDSKMDGRAKRTPHSAFVTENDSGPPRKSIETRCVVLWENESAE